MLVAGAAVLHRAPLGASHNALGDKGDFASGHFDGLAFLLGKPGERQHARDRWEPKPSLPWLSKPARVAPERGFAGDLPTPRRRDASALRRSQICRWLI
jgi:hypothetical protein